MDRCPDGYEYAYPNFQLNAHPGCNRYDDNNAEHYPFAYHYAIAHPGCAARGGSDAGVLPLRPG